MGKKSRLKREAAEARAAATAPFPRLTAAAFMKPPTAPAQPYVAVLAAPPPLTREEEIELVARAVAYERECAEVERLNNTPLGHPDNIEKMTKTFAPIVNWLDEFDRTSGEYEITGNGIAIIRPEGDEAYPIHEAFHAICDTYELITLDRGVEDRSAPLRILANKIHYDSPVMEREIKAARATLEWMKEITAPLTPVEFSNYSVAIQIRATMREQKAA